MKLSQNGDEIYMCIKIDNSYGSKRWIVDFTRWDDEKMSSFYDKPLDSLIIKAYFWDQESLLKNPEYRADPIYGGNIVFHGDFDLWNLKAIAKVGAYIDRELDKLTTKYGRARTFAEQVMRLADVMHVRGFIIFRDYNEHARWACVDASSRESTYRV